MLLKKAATVAAAAASLMMFDAPASAAPAGPPATTTTAGTPDAQSAASSATQPDETSQNGLINSADLQVLDNVNVCDINVGIIVALDIHLPIGDGAEGTECNAAWVQENQGEVSSNTDDPK